MPRLTEAEFIEQVLTPTPPKDCPFKVGDVVTYVNSYDVSFPGKVIIGFSSGYISEESTACVHTSQEAYWFPVDINTLTLDS